MDEVIGHMREKIELPDNYDEIPQAERKRPTCAPEDYLAYGCEEGSKVPAIADFGSGYRWHVSVWYTTKPVSRRAPVKQPAPLRTVCALN